MPKGPTGRPKGRPPGSKSKPKIELDAKLAEAQARATAELTEEQVHALSPLDVMLHAMHIEVQAGSWKMAAILAEKAAPYLHPRLASEVHRVINDDDKRSPEDIRREIDELDRRAAIAAEERTVAPTVPDKPAGILH